ncbi:MAG: PAAR domain-containing protein [Marinovum sp.]|nr:PAAR domain-containing protein [Marinovum sp.]
MPGPPQSRITDPIVGPCTMGAPVPNIGPGATTVLAMKLPAIRVGADQCANMGVPHPIVKGSMTVLIQKMPAARMGDLCAGGGTLVMGAMTVLTGG